MGRVDDQSCVSVVVVNKTSVIVVGEILERFLIDRPFVYRIVKIDEKSRDTSVITLFNGLVYNP